MIIELFWEALLLGRERVLGTQMPSAQNHFYATMPYSGPLRLLYLSLVFPENFGKHKTFLKSRNSVLLSQS